MRKFFLSFFLLMVVVSAFTQTSFSSAESHLNALNEAPLASLTGKVRYATEQKKLDKLIPEASKIVVEGTVNYTSEEGVQSALLLVCFSDKKKKTAYRIVKVDFSEGVKQAEFKQTFYWADDMPKVSNIDYFNWAVISVVK